VPGPRRAESRVCHASCAAIARLAGAAMVSSSDRPSGEPLYRLEAQDKERLERGSPDWRRG